MSKDLSQLLRNGGTVLMAELLRRHKFEFEPAPAEKKHRRHWAAETLLDLYDTAEVRLAELAEDAQRAMALSEARFDWLFVRTAGSDQGAAWRNLTGLDRSLWFLLNDLDKFEQIERRASYETLTSQRKRHTHFIASPGLSVLADAKRIGDFESEVQSLYRQHDGSGRHAETVRFQTSETSVRFPLRRDWLIWFGLISRSCMMQAA